MCACVRHGYVGHMYITTANDATVCLMNHCRAVRAMSETLKQNRLLREQGDDGSFPYSSNDRNIDSHHQKNVCSFILVTEGYI